VSELKANSDQAEEQVTLTGDPRRRRLVLAMVAVGFGGLLMAPVLLRFAPGNQFIRRYANLRPGMTPQQVDRVFGKSAEYDCLLGGFHIRYYFCPTPLGYVQRLDPIKCPPGQRMTSAAQLPTFYASAQLAFDRQNRLSAFTRIGETSVIETIRGPFKGNQLQQLGDGFFVGL
jgi:hypothetical protein